MPRLKIFDHHFFQCDYDPRKIYWKEMSISVIFKFGRKKFAEHQEVEEILLFCFGYLTSKFKDVLYAQQSFQFYKYVFWLHEESIQIYLKISQGRKLGLIEEDEFARHRRILKNILEQGCDIDLTKGQFPFTEKEMGQWEDQLNHLLYLGTWIYHFADHIAFQKMIEDCHSIDFSDEDLLGVNFQYHYGEAYHILFSAMEKEYERGDFELETVPELINKIDDCFNIEFDWARDIIFHIKHKLNPIDAALVTIEPYILPKNLIQKFDISEEEAEDFYHGLTISRENKMSLEELVLKPYSMKRFMYRPILVYKVDGVERALVGEGKFPESIMALATNALNWNSLPEEWLRNPCMKKFLLQKGNEHDKILEDEVEKLIRSKDFFFCRNVKSFKRYNKDNVNINNANCGEIDFIIINRDLKKVIVVDCKYNKARYEAVGYRIEYSNFINSYEPKMQKKHDWVSENLSIIIEHFQIIYKNQGIDFIEYEVETVFFINTPTFYMFNGNFKAITLSQVPYYFGGEYKYDSIVIKHEGKDVKHPFFRKLS